MKEEIKSVNTRKPRFIRKKESGTRIYHRKGRAWAMTLILLSPRLSQ
jgi:hypothetical protein